MHPTRGRRSCYSWPQSSCSSSRRAASRTPTGPSGPSLARHHRLVRFPDLRVAPDRLGADRARARRSAVAASPRCGRNCAQPPSISCSCLIQSWRSPSCDVVSPLSPPPGSCWHCSCRSPPSRPHPPSTCRPGQSIQAAIDGVPAGSVDLDRARDVPGQPRDPEVTPPGRRPRGHRSGRRPRGQPLPNPRLLRRRRGHLRPRRARSQTSRPAPSRRSPMSPIEGITVRDFSGPGIVALGVDGFHVAGVVTAHNGEMGMFINIGVEPLAAR